MGGFTEDGRGDSCTECGEKFASSEDIKVIRIRKVFCPDCWCYFIGGRFRKRLFELGRPPKGTSGEVFRPFDPILVVYDGSPSSVALINLVRYAIVQSRNPDADNPRNIPFPYRFAILVILESEGVGGHGVIEKQKKHLNFLYKWTKSVEAEIGIAFPLIVSSLETSVNESRPYGLSFMKCVRIGDDNWRRFTGEYPVPLKEEYPSANVIGPMTRVTVEDLRIPLARDGEVLCNKVLRNLENSKSSQKDFLNVLKSRLLLEIAQQLNVFKMIFPDDQTSLAIKMFTMMSLGRGAQVADQMSFMCKKNGVLVSRPLMDFSSDDLREYLSCIPSNLTEGLFNNNPVKKRKLKIDTVERQCDEFIVDLQRGYPGTVSTLTRIGGKLEPSSVVQSSSSLNGTSSGLCESECPGQREKLMECKLCKRPMEESDLADLCYGCSHILKDMKEPERLWKLLDFCMSTYDSRIREEQERAHCNDDGLLRIVKKAYTPSSTLSTTGNDQIQVTLPEDSLEDPWAVENFADENYEITSTPTNVFSLS